MRTKILIAAVLYFRTVFSLSTPECHGNSNIVCPCGRSGKQFKLPCNFSRSTDICKDFERCGTCQDGLPRCQTCPLGLTGQFCGDAADGSNLTINQNFTSPPEKSHVRLFRPRRDTSCPDLAPPKLGSISCRFSRQERVCVGRCLPGYYFEKRESSEIRLRCAGRGWQPMQSFPPCKSEGLCDLEMIGPGSYNCTTGIRGTHCDVHCTGYPVMFGRHTCYPGRPWYPDLPYCIQRKGAQPQPRECFCENGGTCNPSTGVCTCLENFSGRRCQEYNYPSEAYCDDPGHIRNGKRVDSRGRVPSPPDTFAEGSTVVYSCRGGFALVGASMLTCQASGSWSSSRPVCRRMSPTTTTTTPATPEPRRVTCRDPGFVPNGHRWNIDGSPLSNYREFFEEGTSVAFSCRDGFALEGLSFITCQSNGRWSRELPKCKRTAPDRTTTTARPTEDPDFIAYCEDPGVEENSEGYVIPWVSPRIASIGPEKEFPEGTRVEYKCKDGYDLRGQRIITCLFTGSWSHPRPTCRSNRRSGPGSLTYCRDPGQIDNGERVVVYPLNERRRPGSSSQFDDEDPEYPQGVRIEYSCYDGYDLVGDRTLACLRTGLWSNSLPECRKGSTQISYCPDPGYISNGKRAVRYPLSERRLLRPSSTSQTQYPEGVKIEYSCYEGFDIIGGPTLLCLPSGSWNSSLPECQQGCGKTFATDVRRIIRGEKTSAGQWPWQVAIAETKRSGEDIFCGGVLVNKKTVVTAAHCMAGKRVNRTVLYFGKHFFSMTNDDELVEKRKPQSFVIHPNYNPVTIDFDIAIIKFAPEVKLNYRIFPVCLPTAATTRANLVHGRFGYVTGWGLTERNVYPDVLMLAEIPVVSSNVCQQAYQEHMLDFPITSNMYCAGYEEGDSDSCSGDSGGPMVFHDNATNRFTLEGLVSFGVDEECGAPKKYTVYTKVSSQLRWIKANI